MPSTAVTQTIARTGLTQALPISEEATTSRVVVNNPLLRQVLFSFDAGQVLTEHASPRAVIVQMISGRIDFEIEGEHHDMGAGDVVYLAPNQRHALRAVEPSYMALTLIDVSAATGTD